jgi:hypothetical protein
MATHRGRRAVAGLALALVLGAVVPPARATVVVRKPLARVAREAGRIVHGTVTAVRVGRDEAGLPATWITLAVVRTVKGPAARQLTLKQFGTAEPLPDGAIGRIAGLPRFAVGDEVVLFLRPESGRGFTSPVGLGQGTYRVRRGAAGARVRRDAPGATTRDLGAFLADVERFAVAP